MLFYGEGLVAFNEGDLLWIVVYCDFVLFYGEYIVVFMDMTLWSSMEKNLLLLAWRRYFSAWFFLVFIIQDLVIFL